jgi:thiamine kinase-like enzyme
LENETLELLNPPPEEKLQGWLAEFYSKSVEIAGRQLLRHRDLSFVERLTIADSLPASLIYKVVAPPWDIELDLHQRVLVPSITSSPTLYMAAHYNNLTVMFFEDLGPRCLKSQANAELATALGEKLARLHRAYSYRIEELQASSVLQTIAPTNYVELTEQICAALSQKIKVAQQDKPSQEAMLIQLARSLSKQFSNEPLSLVHGDFFAENLIPRAATKAIDEIYIIDWSWFAMLGVPIMDLATVTMDHFKNGELLKYRQKIIEAYCFESARPQKEIEKLLPAAELLNRLLFLNWLIVRRKLGIMGTTVGHVDSLIAEVLRELEARAGAI